MLDTAKNNFNEYFNDTINIPDNTKRAIGLIRTKIGFKSEIHCFFCSSKILTISAKSSQNSHIHSIVPKIEQFLMKCNGFTPNIGKTKFISLVDVLLKIFAIFAKHSQKIAQKVFLSI